MTPSLSYHMLLFFKTHGTQKYCTVACCNFKECVVIGRTNTHFVIDKNDAIIIFHQHEEIYINKTDVIYDQ